MIALLLALCAPAQALPSGTVQVQVDGQLIHLPMVHTDVDTHIAGDLASVRLVQTFANPSDQALHATYAFPLPSDAAVHAMRLSTGEVEIEAEVQHAEDAKATFEQAADNGQQAALLTQHRPNVFTQQIANLPAGGEVRIEIHYAHVVPIQDGAYTWTLPLAIGERYVPQTGPAPGEPASVPMSSWTLPPGTHALPGDLIDPDRVSIDITLDAGMPISALEVPTHPTRVLGQGGRRVLQLVENTPVANTDFVMRYRLADEELAAGTTTWAEDGQGVVSLLIDPPAAVEPDRLTPRELVFVVDTSGSMSGAPMETSRRFMHAALDTLRPGDHFQIVRFSKSARVFGHGSLAVTSENIVRGHDWVDRLVADGGTEMRAGVEAALGAPPIPGKLRTVVFLTDGYIGNDADVIRLIEATKADARVFSLGIGKSVNHWLIEEMARVGQGVSRIVEDPETAEAHADALAARIAAPYLTRVWVDWGASGIHAASPEQLPDLHLGQPLRILARYDRPGVHDITVHGEIAGAHATLPLRLDLPANAPTHDALPLAWARWQIEDRMQQYLSPRVGPDERSQLQRQIASLGMEYGLATQWTSFVAVSPEPIPTYQPPTQGVAHQPSSFGGSAAPEPAGWAVMALLSALGLAVRRRRR